MLFAVHSPARCRSRCVQSWFAMLVVCAVGVTGLMSDLAKAAPDKAPTTKSALDLSTPKKAAVAFAKAVETGDMETVKLTAVGTDAQFAVIKGLSDTFQAIKRYEAAAVAKFGDQGKLPFPANLSAEVATHEEAIDGDQATLVSKTNPDNKHPMKLKKDSGAWKVDLSFMDPVTVTAGTAGKAASDAVDVITKNVESGTYKSAAEALAAVGQAMDTAMKPAAK